MINLGKKLEAIVGESKHSVSNARERVEREIASCFSDTGPFLSSLRKGIITTPGDTDFGKVYDLYSKVFTLESERESEESLIKILRLNSNPEFERMHGPLQEIWLFLLHPDNREVVGASNIDIYVSGNQKAQAFGTVHEIYVMTAPEYRNLGVGSLLLQLNRRYAHQFMHDKAGTAHNGASLYVLNEQNDPLKMTVSQYITDTQNAGIDQCDRLMWWQRRGYGVLDFEYVQPPLSGKTEPCRYLNLFISAPSEESVQSSLVFGHLLRFAHFTVLQGKNPREDPTFIDVERRLKSKERLEILRPDYKRLKSAIYNLNITPQQFDTPIGQLVRL